MFFTLVKKLSQDLNVGDPVLPRKRRFQDVWMMAVSTAALSLRELKNGIEPPTLKLWTWSLMEYQFDQPGCAIYCNPEELLVKRTSGEECDQKKQVCELYNEINGTQLNVQLESLATYFQSDNIPFPLKECIKYLQELSPDAKAFYSEVCTLKELILVMPATNALSFSVMHRVKNYLRSTIRQERLNHVMVLNIYKEELDKLEPIAVANKFVSDSEHRKRFFGTFT